MKTYIVVITLTFFSHIIFAQQENQTSLKQSKDSLLIIISCDKTEFIQGESIDILVKIKNTTSRTIRIGSPKHYLYVSDKDSTCTNQYGNAIVDIPPYGNYYFFVDPTYSLVCNEVDYSTHSLIPGNYEYYISQFEGKNEFISNKIKITPVSDSLRMAFEDLKYSPQKSYEALYEKYKGTFFAQQFLYDLLSIPTYLNEVAGAKAELYKEFIIKYPDNLNSLYFLKRIMDSPIYNKTLVEDIITSLKDYKPQCKLLEVLKNQTEHIKKKIDYLLK